jgi:hypothetical protein
MELIYPSVLKEKRMNKIKLAAALITMSFVTEKLVADTMLGDALIGVEKSGATGTPSSGASVPLRQTQESERFNFNVRLSALQNELNRVKENISELAKDFVKMERERLEMPGSDYAALRNHGDRWIKAQERKHAENGKRNDLGPVIK